MQGLRFNMAEGRMSAENKHNYEILLMAKEHMNVFDDNNTVDISKDIIYSTAEEYNIDITDVELRKECAKLCLLAEPTCDINNFVDDLKGRLSESIGNGLEWEKFFGISSNSVDNYLKYQQPIEKPQ